MFVKNVANHALIPPHRALVPPLKSPPYGGGPIPPHVKICMDNPVKKKSSIFVDIVQIEVDLPHSYLTFDKFIFDILLIMLTSPPPLEFLTKIIKF